MKYSEAVKIFEEWQDYSEINDKLNKVFQKIPESFLPYPKKELEQALTIVASDQASAGNKTLVDAISTSLVTLGLFYDRDDRAIENILTGLLTHSQARGTLLESLAKTRDSWLEFKSQSHGTNSSDLSD